jgi:hypothetical protein
MRLGLQTISASFLKFSCCLCIFCILHTCFGLCIKIKQCIRICYPKQKLQDFLQFCHLSYCRKIFRGNQKWLHGPNHPNIHTKTLVIWKTTHWLIIVKKSLFPSLLVWNSCVMVSKHGDKLKNLMTHSGSHATVNLWQVYALKRTSEYLKLFASSSLFEKHLLCIFLNMTCFEICIILQLITTRKCQENSTSWHSSFSTQASMETKVIVLK